MSNVVIQPRSDHHRGFSIFWCRGPASVFPDGDPSVTDIELARELWRALDLENRAWYVLKGRYCGFDSVELTKADWAALHEHDEFHRRFPE